MMNVFDAESGTEGVLTLIDYKGTRVAVAGRVYKDGTTTYFLHNNPKFQGARVKNRSPYLYYYSWGLSRECHDKTYGCDMYSFIPDAKHPADYTTFGSLPCDVPPRIQLGAVEVNPADLLGLPQIETKTDKVTLIRKKTITINQNN